MMLEEDVILASFLFLSVTNDTQRYPQERAETEQNGCGYGRNGGEKSECLMIMGGVEMAKVGMGPGVLRVRAKGSCIVCAEGLVEHLLRARGCGYPRVFQ